MAHDAAMSHQSYAIYWLSISRITTCLNATVARARSRTEERLRRAADSVPSGSAAPPRLRALQADRDTVGRRFEISGRFAVSAAVPPRETGLDSGALG